MHYDDVYEDDLETKVMKEVLETKVMKEVLEEEVITKTTKKYYKVMNEDYTHFNYTYTLGLNILQDELDLIHDCSKGGFYFSDLKDIHLHLNTPKKSKYICEVTLLEDSILVTFQDKYKTDKLILSNPLEIPDFVEKHKLQEVILNSAISNFKYIKNPTKELTLQYIKDYNIFHLVKNPTPELCLFAVKSFSQNLRYVPKELITSELCLISVTDLGSNLYFVPEQFQTTELILIAIEQHKSNIKYINDILITKELLLEIIKIWPSVITYEKVQSLITPEMCIVALQKKMGLSNIPEELQTEEMCKIAVTNNYKDISECKIQTTELSKLAVQVGGWRALSYIKEHTEELYLELFNQEEKENDMRIHFSLILEYIEENLNKTMSEDFLIKFFKYDNNNFVKSWNNLDILRKTEKLNLILVQQNGLLLEHIKNQTSEVCLVAILQNGNAFRFIKIQTEKLCKIAITKDYTNLRFVKDQTLEICLETIELNPKAFLFVREQKDELNLIAIRKDINNFKYVKNKTRDLCIEALKLDPSVIKYINLQTRDLCIEAIKLDYNNLEFIREQTVELCLLAVNKNRLAFRKIRSVMLFMTVLYKYFI